MLHETRTCAGITARMEGLGPENPRKWGKMTIDQMVWHLNQGLLSALGQLPMERMRSPLPVFLMKPMVLGLRWPHGTPTAPEFLAVSRHDFALERERCLTLMADFARRSLDGNWAPHMIFGPMSGRDWSRLMYRHLDHHLRQFSA